MIFQCHREARSPEHAAADLEVPSIKGVTAHRHNALHPLLDFYALQAGFD